jgi:HEAT repeat protein
MSEHSDDSQEPEGNRQGRASRVIFAVLLTVVLSGLLPWLFVPSVRVLAYQTILTVGPSSARLWSVEKLASYGDLALEPLSIALKDKDKKVRFAATEALMRLGQEIPVRIVQLKDKDEKVRSYAARALGFIDWNASPALAEKAASRSAVAESAVTALIEALGDKEELVRHNAVEALGKIGRSAEKAVPALLGVLKDEDSGLRKPAAVALGRIGRNAGPRNAGPRNAGPRNADPTVAEKAVQGLIEALGGKDKYLRRAAAVSLYHLFAGQIGRNTGPALAEKAIPGLIEALGDKDEKVREQTVKALGKIGRARSRIVGPVVTALIKALGDTEKDVREEAAKALGKIGPTAEKAVPALLGALKDRNSRVRKRVKEALEEIQKK